METTKNKPAAELFRAAALLIEQGDPRYINDPTHNIFQACGLAAGDDNVVVYTIPVFNQIVTDEDELAFVDNDHRIVFLCFAAAFAETGDL